MKKNRKRTNKPISNKPPVPTLVSRWKDCVVDDKKNTFIQDMASYLCSALPLGEQEFSGFATYVKPKMEETK